VDDASRTVTDLLSDSPNNNSPGGAGGGWKGRVIYDTEGGGAGRDSQQTKNQIFLKIAHARPLDFLWLAMVFSRAPAL